MASEKLFESCPPFPDDLPLAPLHVVSLAGLRRGEQAVLGQLLASSQELGFFLLDLYGDETGEALMTDIDQLFEAEEQIMNLPAEVKAEYPHIPPKTYCGFKPRGYLPTEIGQPDRYESFNMAQDGLVGNDHLQPLPPLIHDYVPLFTTFVSHSQAVVGIILRTLATQLGLPTEAFMALHPIDKPSGTTVRLNKTFASVDDADLRTGLIHHTDFGSITLLANVLGGLQILAPNGTGQQDIEDETAWLWVRPKPGHLIVNLGDAIVQWTGGLLRSNVHRIRYAPGEQRYQDRLSLALLVRPERNASMRPLLGETKSSRAADEEELTAWEWEKKKTFAMMRGEAVVQSSGGKPLAVGV